MSDFLNILSGIAINPVLREKVKLLENLYEAKEKEVVDLQLKITDLLLKKDELVKELQGLRDQLADQSEAEQFVSYRGACFKKDFTGKFEPVVYCPKCKQSTCLFNGSFHCGSCHWHSPFSDSELS